MKKIILSASILFSAIGYTQLTNSVPPSGPVGIGTMSPYPGTQLTVNGVARILNTLTVDGVLTASNSAILNSYVRMAGIDSYSGDLEDIEILVRTADGNIVRETVLDLAIGLGTPPEEISYCGVSEITHPRWFHGINKLFSPCPQVNVGIGTFNPTHNLDVKGTTFTINLKIGNELGSDTALINAYAFNHSQPLMQLGKKIGASSTELRFLINNDGSIIITNIGSNPALTINNGSGHALVVNDNSGNKLVQLENNGLFRTRRIKVDSVVWADYVFNNDYKLLTLSEIEHYINKYGHLPNIPSAKKIEEDGLDIAEMQKLQMEKIEELTLHLIEMNKEITSIKSENQKLKQDLNHLTK